MTVTVPSVAVYLTFLGLLAGSAWLLLVVLPRQLVGVGGVSKRLPGPATRVGFAPGAEGEPRSLVVLMDGEEIQLASVNSADPATLLYTARAPHKYTVTVQLSRRDPGTGPFTAAPESSRK